MVLSKSGTNIFLTRTSLQHNLFSMQVLRLHICYGNDLCNHDDVLLLSAVICYYYNHYDYIALLIKFILLSPPSSNFQLSLFLFLFENKSIINLIRYKKRYRFSVPA